MLSSTVEFREKIPIKMSLDQFPLKVGEWSADRRLPIAQMFLDELDLSEYVMVNYNDRSGKSVNFYVAYYESQSKGKSIHSPASCLPGSGWDFRQSGTMEIADTASNNGAGKSVNFYVAYYETQSKGKSIHSPATCLPGSGWDFRQSGAVTISNTSTNDGAMRVNRAVMQLGSKYQISYYWFPQRGRILTNAYMLKLFVFWDALTKQRTDGALVRLVTQVYEGEKLEEAEERLQKFVRDIVPVLEEYIPGREI